MFAKNLISFRKKRDAKSRSMSINFTSDGGGMLRAISLEDLFKSIDYNRSTSPIELMPMRPTDDGKCSSMLTIKSSLSSNRRFSQKKVHSLSLSLSNTPQRSKHRCDGARQGRKN